MIDDLRPPGRVCSDLGRDARHRGQELRGPMTEFIVALVAIGTFRERLAARSAAANPTTDGARQHAGQYGSKDHDVKVLLSALAAEPGRGSELEVGYRAMLAAARKHEVWVLTNADTRSCGGLLLRAARQWPGSISRDRVRDGRAHVHATDCAGFHWYYDRWQRRAAARALELERHIGFDLVHHVTLASYWTRAGASVVDKPLVWERRWREVKLPGMWSSGYGDLGRTSAGS